MGLTAGRTPTEILLPTYGPKSARPDGLIRRNQSEIPKAVHAFKSKGRDEISDVRSHDTSPAVGVRQDGDIHGEREDASFCRRHADVCEGGLHIMHSWTTSPKHPQRKGTNICGHLWHITHFLFCHLIDYAYDSAMCSFAK